MPEQPRPGPSRPSGPRPHARWTRPRCRPRRTSEPTSRKETPHARGRSIVEAGIGLILAALAIFACALLTQTMAAS
jgi:hypothetical protein